MQHMPQPDRRRSASDAGFSLAEFMVSMGVLTVVMGATMGGLSDVIKGNDAVLQMTTMNSSLRAGMDLIVRDLLQVGSGLPPGHAITIPNGTGAGRVKIPGPPGTGFQTDVGATTIGAVIPQPGRGPKINGVDTDVITVMMADNTFLNVATTAVGSNFVTVATGVDLEAGADRVAPGQLMMIMKGSLAVLAEVTSVDLVARRLNFADGDSLNLNQSGAASGNLPALNAAEPANSPAHTNVSRVRMITYYLDADTDAKHPRLTRRVNNGDPMYFDNSLGTAVAMDVENLQFTFDISNGLTNPGNVEMTALDRTAAGACNPSACAATQIRKVNVMLTGRSSNAVNTNLRSFRNTLQSQVSLRGMAFVDEYRSTF